MKNKERAHKTFIVHLSKMNHLSKGTNKSNSKNSFLKCEFKDLIFCSFSKSSHGILSTKQYDITLIIHSVKKITAHAVF